MDELYASGMKLAYPPEYSIIFERGDKADESKVKRNRADCPSYMICVQWSINQKNLSFVLSEIDGEANYAIGEFYGENSEPLVCKLEDGVFLQTGATMYMFHGDPLTRRVNEIIDRVFEAGIYNHWISLEMNWYKILSRKISLVHPFDEYYNFNLYHMQPAFYLLLMGWCLSAFCFMAELLYNRVFSGRN